MPPQTQMNVTVSCENSQYKVNTNGTTITKITILSPQNINGLTYNYNGTELVITLGSLSYKPSAEMPQNPITLLNNALNEIRTYKNYTIKSCDENNTRYNFNKFIVDCDTVSGDIKNIISKQENISYKFS